MSGIWSAAAWAQQHDKLPPGARHVLLTLVLHRNFKTGQCNPSQATLARETGYSDRSIRTHLTLLASDKWKLIERVPQRRSDGTRGPDNFKINFDQEEWELVRKGGSDKRKDLPVGDQPSGKSRQTNRKFSPNLPENISGKLLIELQREPSGSPSGDPGAPARARDPDLNAGHFSRGDDNNHAEQRDPDHDRNQAKRGTRLAPNWQPGDWDLAYGRDRGFHDAEITDHAANFKTHFTAGRGRNTTHLRWSGGGCSAFAVWLRKETPGQLGRGQSHARHGHAGAGRREVASVVEAVGEVIDSFSDPVAREPGDRRPA